MRHISARGIILRKANFGEHDQFVSIFSPTLGKIDAIAKGSRKITSTFIGHLEVLNICKFQLYKSAHHFTITQCQTEHSFKKIREKFQLTMLSFLILEIFHKITQAEENSEELFDLLKNTLSKIEEDTKNELHLEYFKIKILKYAGSLADVSRCNICHHRWEPKDTIEVDLEGHIFCTSCAPSKSSCTEIPFNTMKLIHFLSQSSQDKVQNISLSAQEKAALKKIADIFLQNYLSVELKSEKIVASLPASPP